MNKKALLTFVLGVVVLAALWFVYVTLQGIKFMQHEPTQSQAMPTTSSDLPPAGHPGSSAPPGATEACTGKTLGATCNFDFEGAPVVGSCQRQGETLACGPDLSATSTASSTH